ncbi:MAG: hypothetical protein IJW29_06150 [Clostridia bacterium]|nr:hypothetical protein [Clostridia bacterium]
MAKFPNFNKRQQRQAIPDSSVPFTLANGETVDLVLSWRMIERLRVTRDESYPELSKILVKGADDAMDNMRLLHAAYRCGYIVENGRVDGAMSYLDFIDLVPDDFGYVMKTVAALLDPKSNRDSEALS